MTKRVFLSDKAFSQLVTFIAERHFTYMIDTEIEPNNGVEHVTEAVEPNYHKLLKELRQAFDDCGADFDEFFDLFFDGSYETNYRHPQIREVFKRYYPESMRKELENKGEVYIMNNEALEVQYVSEETYNRILANVQNWVFLRQTDKWIKKGKLRSDFEYYDFIDWYVGEFKFDGGDVSPLIVADGASPKVFENFCAGNDDKAGILRVLNTYKIKRD